MKVEIWSDIVCPFCYIGKREFETALNNFTAKDKVEIVWRSFQLDPGLKQIPGQPVYAYMAKRKGIGLPEAKEMYDYMADRAKTVGLLYNFDKAIINNTMDGHRLSHYAADFGKQNEIEEKLFAAYYTEGKDIGELETLVKIGESVGLEGEKVRTMLQSDKYRQDVLQDQQTAQQLGVNGVPFFVFDNRYAVSGAQPSDVFRQVLEKTWEETEKTKPTPITGGQNADACDIDGSNC
jgi:predicted DsbA family dithiol-disulfide isomerase